MAPTQPYQPSLLRLLHGAVAVLIPLAWLSGLAVLINHDRRWFAAAWQIPGDWVDIHGTIGVGLWPLALLFGFYALSLGRQRLNGAANAAPLLVLGLAVGSGKLMDEDWLREGNLNHLVYNLHVLAWALLAAVVIWHVGSAISRGGTPLVRSMFAWTLRSNDGPAQWPGQLRRWFGSRRKP